MKNNNAEKREFGFAALLTIIFIVLKICGVITWKWVWIFAPLWISAILVLICIIVILVAMMKKK